ncbi:platelet glycoprotein IX [Poecilia latipinna]|uniref:Platelet glycoprotein IX-like n=1 Tax=Poecilia latipinna TaxID=48699 RepID=A0A3B3URK8_9TELE|nr:PREDICTED: platelet glycoprotein IX-like [Poecilia latipinna]
MLLHSVTLAVYLLLASSSAQRTVQSCVFSELQPSGLRVNCSSLNLMELPHLPSETTELFVQDNRLTSVPPGKFDRLANLRKVSLSPNPFRCDCSIQYLRYWLLKNRAVVSEEPLCSSPGSVAQNAITDLSDAYFSYCTFPLVHQTSTSGCVYVSYNTIASVMLCCIIILLLWSLILARKSTFTIYVEERHSGFEADSLRSLKPKHRRRLHPELSELSADSESVVLSEDLERPLISKSNMELLPQVLETLHKKHNIKIKAN